MFVYWGKKAVRKFLGFAADFCSIDRSCQPFSVFGVSIASHVYGLAVGSGKVIGYEIVCRRCATAIPLKSLPYTQLSEQERSLNDLITLTFPNIQAEYWNRLQVEKMVNQDPRNLSQAERKFLIQEPFEQLDHDAGKIARDLYIDKSRGIGCAGILGGVILSITIAVYTKEPYTTIGSWTAAGLLFIGIVYTLFLSATGPKKAFRERLLPRLLKALGPLAPEKEELQACLKKYKSVGGKITRFITTDRLFAELQRVGQYDYSLIEQRANQSEETPAFRMQFSFYDSSQRVQTKVFSVPLIKIGSGQACDLQFSGLFPEHCQVYLSNEGYYAQDLGGGLMINEKSGSGFLNNNDVLYLGNVSIRFNI